MIAKQGWTKRFADAMENQMYHMTNIIQLNHEIDAINEIIELYSGTVFSDEIPAWVQKKAEIEIYKLEHEVMIKDCARVMQDEIPDPS